jgi:serine protease Do
VEKEVKIVLIRNGEEVTLNLEVGEYPEEGVDPKSDETLKKFGIDLQVLTPELAESFGFEKDTKGILVADVEMGSPADEVGIRQGDVIIEINRRKVVNMEEAQDAMDLSEKGKSTLFLIKRGKSTLYLVVNPGGE